MKHGVSKRPVLETWKGHISTIKVGSHPGDCEQLKLVPNSDADCEKKRFVNRGPTKDFLVESGENIQTLSNGHFYPELTWVTSAG